MKKKLVLIVTALTLCAAIAVGGTLAYLNDTDGPLENVFTYDNSEFGEGSVVIELAETRWSKEAEYQFAGDPAPDPSVPDPNHPGFNKFGEDKAKFYIPGTLIAKDPQVKLLSKVDSYIGLSVSKPEAGWANIEKIDYAAVMDAYPDNKILAAVDWNIGTGTDNWTYLGEDATTGARYFVYNGIVSHDEGDLSKLKTSNLFTTVRINELLDKKDIDTEFAGKGSFKLEITAYGVQAVVESQGDAWTPVKALETQFSTIFGQTNLINKDIYK